MTSQSTGSPLRLILFLCCALCANRAASEPEEHAHEHGHPEHEAAETIVVTGSPLEHDRDELAIPIDRISRSELLRNLGSTVGETLTHVPGITTSGFAAGASRPVIRGQDAYRTEVLEDGLRTQDVSRESPDHAVPTNPLAAQRIEVIRGPAALRYGGGASAGVVNVITRRVPDRLPENGVQGELFGGIGTAADERDLAGSLEFGEGNFAFHADALLRTSNNYSIPNDSNPHTQSGTSTDAWAGSVGTSYFHDLGRVGFSYSRVESDYGIPVEDDSVRIEMHTDRFRFEGDLDADLPGIREVRVRGVYSDYEHDEIADGEVGQTYRNEEFEGRLELIHEPVAGFLGAVGVQGRYRDFRGEGEAAEFLAPAETTMAAVYLYEERELGSIFTAELGMRLEHTEVEGRDITDRDRNKSFLPLSGSVGLVANPLEWLTLGLTGAISQRAPSQVELLARGAHEATATFEIGDPNLGMETSYSGDFRLTAKNGRGTLELAGFATHYDDFIFASLTGIQVDEDGVAPGDLDQLFYTNRNALFVGAEASGRYDVITLDCGDFGLDGRFDIVHARFAGQNHRRVPRIVPIRWGGGVYFESESLSARVGFLRTEAQEDNARFETSTASFTMLDASVTYRLALVDDRIPIELTAVGRNLTDVRGRNHVSFNKDNVLLPGRDLRFGVRARF